MSNWLQQPTAWQSHLLARPEVAPEVSELLPSWDAPGTIVGVVSFDGYVVAVSESFQKLLGWMLADLTSAPFWEFVHAEDQHPVVESIGRLMMRTCEVPLGVDLRALRRDGTCVWIRWQTVADPNSELIYGVGEDASDEMPAEQARFHVGTWTRDIDAGTVDWSDEVYEMFGLPVGKAVDDDLVKASIDPQDLPLVERAWHAAIAGEDDYLAQFRVTRPNGTIRTLRSTGRVTARTDGNPLTVRGLTIDVTDRHRH
jgi:PAS domain S-box-containing protein